MGLALAILSLAPLTSAVAQNPPPQIVNLPPVNLAFDANINPLGQFGLTSSESRAITADHSLARQEVALAIAYLSANRIRIEAGNDSIYNRIFGGFYDHANPNYARGYAVDDSHYMRVLRTYATIQSYLNRPTFYSSGIATNNGVARLFPGSAIDFFDPKFKNLDRGLRQWGMSNSDSEKVYNAYFPPSYNGLNGHVGTIYPTGQAPGGLGSGQLVHWDQDTAQSKPGNPNNTTNLGNYFANNVPDALPPNPNPQLVYNPIVQVLLNGTTVSLASPLTVYDHSNLVFAQSMGGASPLNPGQPGSAFFHQKLDIFGAWNNPNIITLGDVFFNNTQANRAANAPIERKGDITAALVDKNVTGLQTLPWNSGFVPGYTTPNVPLNSANFFRASDWQVPELQRYQMIIASFAEFTTNPLDPRGGAFFGIDALVKATDPGVSQLIAGAFDAGAFGQFVQALNDGGFSDPRNFPPVGKNGSFQPAIPGG